jgi:ubiquinone/menaquinone biosynthesis C-methylase UbiE
MTKNECTNQKENVNKHYEIQWEGYSDKDIIARVANLSSVIDPILSYLPKTQNIKVLDLGCGPAVIPLRMAQIKKKESKMEIYGIDISNTALKVASGIIGENQLDFIHLILADCESLPFSQNGFDCVVSNVTFNLLIDKPKGFSEMVRVLKEGGILVIGDCVKEEAGQTCQDSQNESNLWSQCVAGAPTKSDIVSLAKSNDLKILDTQDLTKTVMELVKNQLWDWPEFLEHNLKYHVFAFKKG